MVETCLLSLLVRGYKLCRGGNSHWTSDTSKKKKKKKKLLAVWNSEIRKISSRVITFHLSRNCWLKKVDVAISCTHYSSRLNLPASSHFTFSIVTQEVKLAKNQGIYSYAQAHDTNLWKFTSKEKLLIKPLHHIYFPSQHLLAQIQQ